MPDWADHRTLPNGVSTCWEAAADRRIPSPVRCSAVGTRLEVHEHADLRVYRLAASSSARATGHLRNRAIPTREVGWRGGSAASSPPRPLPHRPRGESSTRLLGAIDPVVA